METTRVPEQPPDGYENKYDAWKEVDMKRSSIKLRRLYNDSIDQIQRQLDEAGFKQDEYVIDECEWGAAVVQHPFRRVTFNLPLEELGIPEKANVGETFTFDSMVSFLEIGENLSVDKDSKKDDLRFLAGSNYQRMVNFVRSHEFLKKKVPQIAEWDSAGSTNHFWDISSERPGQFYGIDSYYAYTIIPSEWSDKHSVNFKSLKTKIETLLDGAPDGLTEEWKNILNEDYRMPRDNAEGTLCPNGVLYFDAWQDPRFDVDYIPGTVVIGTIPRNQGVSQSTIDAGSEVFMQRLASRHLKEDYPSEGVYSPQNLTNLYLFGFPVITEKIAKLEKRLNPEEIMSPFGLDGSPSTLSPKYDGRLRVFICNQPQRINPDTIAKDLDTRFGENSWLLVTQDADLNLKQIVPEDKSEWRVTSKAITRTKIPPIDDSYIGEERMGSL